MKRWLAFLAWTFACNQSISDAIPCHGDDECPTEYFCGSAGSCISNAASSPARLALVGVRKSKDEQFGASITMPAKGLNSFSMAIEDLGGSEAAYPDVTMSAAACLHVDAALASNLIGILRPNEPSEQTVYIHPDPGCASPVAVHVTMTIKDSSFQQARTFGGDFEVVLE